MYNIFKDGSDIYLSPWRALDRDPKFDRVYFHAKSKKPEEWTTSVVSTKDHDIEKHIQKYIKLLPDKARVKWEPFAEEILELAEKNHKLLRQKAVQALNEKFRNQPGNSSSDQYFVKFNDSKYESGCWNCGTGIDSDYDLHHKECRWLICGHCGACGCGYHGRK